MTKPISGDVIHFDPEYLDDYAPDDGLVLPDALPGTALMLAAQQRNGMIIASELAAYPYRDPTARSYIFAKLTMALLNSSQQNSPQYAEKVMVKAFDLLTPTQDYQKLQLSRERIANSIDQDFATAIDASTLLLGAHMDHQPIDDLKLRFGRKAGSIAVRIIYTGMTPMVHGQNGALTLQDARTFGLDMIDQARDAQMDTGVHPSITFLAEDPRNTWFVGAPDEAQEALDKVYEQYG